MADANLNEVFRALGELTAAVRGVDEKVNRLREDMSESERDANASRANTHRRLDDIVLRATNIEVDVLAAKNRLDRVETVTEDVRKLRERAMGAGTLGRWVIRGGLAVVTVAGWVVSVYVWMTGRPPP